MKTFSPEMKYVLYFSYLFKPLSSKLNITKSYKLIFYHKRIAFLSQLFWENVRKLYKRLDQTGLVDPCIPQSQEQPHLRQQDLEGLQEDWGTQLLRQHCYWVNSFDSKEKKTLKGLNEWKFFTFTFTKLMKYSWNIFFITYYKQ